MPLMSCGCIFFGLCFCADGEVCGLRAAICAFQLVLTGNIGPSLRGRGLLFTTLDSRAILEAAVSRR
jgi:hypothetical protein